MLSIHSRDEGVNVLEIVFAFSCARAMCIPRYIGHLWRRGKRRLMKRYRLYLYKRQQKREQNLLKEQQQHGHQFRGSAVASGPNRLSGGECFILPLNGIPGLGCALSLRHLSCLGFSIAFYIY